MKKIQVEKIDTFTGHKDCVYALENSIEQKCFYSAGGDGLVVEWRLDIPDLGKPIAKVHNSVYAIALEKKSALLWVGHNFEGIHIIDPIKKVAVGSVKLASAPIFDIKFHNNHAFVAGGDGVITVIEISTLTFVKHIKIASSSCRTLSLNTQTNQLAVGTSDNSIVIIDLLNFSVVKSLTEHQNSVFAVGFTHDYKFLISGGRDAKLICWDVENNYSLHKKINAHLFAINDIVFSPDGIFFATCSMDKSIKLWDVQTFNLLKVIDKGRFTGHATSINKLLWTTYQNQLLSGSDDRTISSWKIAENQ